MFKQAREFVWNHRGKLVLTTTVAIAGIAYCLFFGSATLKKREQLDADVMELEHKEGSTEDDRSIQHIAMKQGVRSRLLLRVRRHFDFAGKHLFPTLRIKLLEAVDISNAIQQIKQIRLGGLVDMTAKSTEANLWDQIKISSFVMLFSACYGTSIVTMILKLQLHILAKNASIYSDDDNGTSSPSEKELKYLIDSTFKYVYGDGLKKLTDLLRVKVSSALVDWTVREKSSVQFVEFVDCVSYIRKSVEKDMKTFVDMTTHGICFIQHCAKTKITSYPL